MLSFYFQVVDVDVDKEIPLKPQDHYLVKNYHKETRRLFEFVLIRKKDILLLLEIVLKNMDAFKKKEQAMAEASSLVFQGNFTKFNKFKQRFEHPLFRLQNWGGCLPCAKINDKIAEYTAEWQSLTP